MPKQQRASPTYNIEVNGAKNHLGLTPSYTKPEQKNPPPPPKTLNRTLIIPPSHSERATPSYPRDRKYIRRQPHSIHRLPTNPPPEQHQHKHKKPEEKGSPKPFSSVVTISNLNFRPAKPRPLAGAAHNAQLPYSEPLTRHNSNTT